MVVHEQKPESAWPHRLAVLLCLTTFPLIWLGGLVTTYDAGMAVPDWPGTYGYNLFLYPWTTWLFGPWDLFIEHGHRLLAALAGLVAIALVLSTYWGQSRALVRYSAWGALGLVIFQGMLGGARVLLDERSLAMVHGCVGPSFFAFAAFTAMCSSERWKLGLALESKLTSGLRRLAVTTAVLAWLQLLLGAQLRHVTDSASPATFGLFVQFHVLIAVALFGHVGFLLRRACQLGRGGREHQAMVCFLALLVTAQIALGISTWVVKYGWPVWFADYRFAATYTIQAASLLQSIIVTAHVAIGALILATSVVCAVGSFRFLRSRQPAVAPSATFVGCAS